MTNTIKTLVSMVCIATLLVSCGCGSGDKPGLGTDTETSTSVICDMASGGCTTITKTSTDTTTVTATDTTTVTGTDTNTATWPAWCNGDPDAPELGARTNLTGLWNVTCDGVQWNLYITYNNSDVSKDAGGYAFKTTELDWPDPIPSLTEYKGSAATNCVWLNPTAQNPSLMTSPPPVLKGTAVVYNATQDATLIQITGGSCTIEWHKENQICGSGTGCPHYVPPSP